MSWLKRRRQGAVYTATDFWTASTTNTMHHAAPETLLMFIAENAASANDRYILIDQTGRILSRGVNGKWPKRLF